VTRATLPFDLRIPSGWEVEPFGRVVTRIQETGRPDARPLSVYLDQGVVPRDSRDDNFNRLGADLAKYLVVREGDIVFNKLRTWQGGLGVSKFDGIVSPAYFVCRPSAAAEPRFLHYLLRSRVYLEELTRISKWMPPSQFDIAWHDLRSLPILLPPPKTQRAIATFLEHETTRIDTLIAAKQRMIELLKERLNASIEARLNAVSTEVGTIPLKFLAHDVTVGIVVTPSEWYAEIGVPALRGLNIDEGTIDLHDLIYISDEGHRLHRKSELRAGDLVTVRTGQAGTTAVVPPDLEGANCIDLLITRPGARISPQFLELVFNSDWVTKHVEENSVGAIQSHFNVDALKNLPVPSVPVETQRSIAVELLSERTATGRLMASLTRQIDLLTERRQALITAAVAGEIEIPVVAA